jgi:hypothetical protein
MNKKQKFLVFGLIKVVKYAALGIFAVYSGSNSGSATTTALVPFERFGLDPSMRSISCEPNKNLKQFFPMAEVPRHP